MFLSSGRSASWNNGTRPIFVVGSLHHCAPALVRRSRRCFLNGNLHTRAYSKRTEMDLTEYATETP